MATTTLLFSRLALAMGLLFGQISGGAAQTALELHLEPEKVTVRQGEQLDLVLTLTNRSRDPVGFIVPNFQNAGLRPYYFELLSPEGKVLEVEGRAFLGGRNETIGPHFHVLEPMDSCTWEIEINGWAGWKGNYYTLEHLKRQGTYILRMRYHPHRASCDEVFSRFFGPDYLETCDDELNRRVWLPPDFILSNSVTVTVAPPRKGARMR